MDTPRISIVIAVYNGERHLPDAFQSILDQTMAFESMEVILVNDGSEDASGAMIDGYSRRYGNVRAIHFNAPSGGGGRPWNAGFDIAKGDYLMILGADDVFLPNACELLYKSITTHKSDIASGIYDQSDSRGVMLPAIFQRVLPDPVVNVRVEECPALLVAPPAIAARIYDRGFMERQRIRFPEGIIAQDAVFAAEALLAARNITYIPEVIFTYRIRQDPSNPSMSQRLTVKYFRDFARTRETIIDLYARKGTVDYFRIRYLLDVNFALGCLVRAGDTAGTNRVEMLDALRWFFQLYTRVDMDNVQLTKLALIKLITAGDYEDAIEILDLLAKVDKVVTENRDLEKNLAHPKARRRRESGG